MDATTYTGTGSTQSITNAASFKPDLVWTKSRSNAYNNCLIDSVRGVSKALFSDTTGAEDNAPTAYVTAFNTNGFAVNAGTGSNGNGATYVGWQWKAGGTAVTNTSGSISSQVSANTTSGFSVVTWTQAAPAATIGHGLGVAPKFIIVKQRNVVNSWYVASSLLSGADTALVLNQTLAATTYTNLWNNTAPTSSVFSIGTAWGAGNMVAYCWSEIAGYSAFGSYTGNGSADGPFVYTGFRPKFVLLKRSSGVENWQIYDTARDTYNAAGLQLLPNTSGAEADGRPILDILSNGFKLRNSSGGGNASADYIYATFAENPFKYANAR